MKKENKLETIIEKFADEIKTGRILDGPQSFYTIDFRNELREKKNRKVYAIPIELLRFRKNNTRIKSDVLSYEKENAYIDVNTEDGQKKIKNFLKNKDPSKTEELKQLILDSGQKEPAIITCDGFLVNGNRRRLVLEMLLEETGKPEFSQMRVVILPDKKDEGGAPTIREILKIERRYQFNSDGKSDYLIFDKALSIRENINKGSTLEEQMKDMSVYSGMSEKKFNKEVENFRDDFLGPLECVDRYLNSIERPGIYTLVSENVGNKDSRWTAFVDYYQKTYKKLEKPKERIKFQIDEKEFANIEDVCFKIIRIRDFSKLDIKVHMLMRNLLTYLKNPKSKEEIFKINKIKNEVDISNPEDIEKKWINKNKKEILQKVACAINHSKRKDGQDKPIDLLNQALNKLNHNDMNPNHMPIKDLSEAIEISKDIKDRANELESEFFKRKRNKGEKIQLGK